MQVQLAQWLDSEEGSDMIFNYISIARVNPVKGGRWVIWTFWRHTLPVQHIDKGATFENLTDAKKACVKTLNLPPSWIHPHERM